MSHSQSITDYRRLQADANQASCPQLKHRVSGVPKILKLCMLDATRRACSSGFETSMRQICSSF
eukprot:1159134-Pelagomonas_calceolata.AAC.14